MRMTVHLFPTDDFGWLTPLFKERIVSWSMRRLEALGLTPAERDRALAAIRKAIEREGAVTRNEAMEVAASTGIEVDVQRRTHLSVITVVGGTACIGPDHGRGSVFVDTREWIGDDQIARARGLLGRARPPLLRRLRSGQRARLREVVGAAPWRVPHRHGADRRRARAARPVEPGAVRPERLRPAGAALARRAPASRLRHLPHGLREPRARRGRSGREG